MTRKKKGIGKFIVAGAIIVVAVLIAAYTLVPSVSTFASESLQNMGLATNDFGTRILAAVVNNCKTVHYTEDVWTGQNIPGVIGYPNKELFEKEKYTSTATVSNVILVKGNIYKSAIGQTSVSQRAYYVISILEIGKNNNAWKKIVGLNYKDASYVSYLSGMTWLTFKSYPSDASAQIIRASTDSLTIKGLHKAAIKVDFIVEFKNSKTNRIYEKIMATDYAYLV